MFRALSSLFRTRYRVVHTRETYLSRFYPERRPFWCPFWLPLQVYVCEEGGVSVRSYGTLEGAALAIQCYIETTQAPGPAPYPYPPGT